MSTPPIVSVGNRRPVVIVGAGWLGVPLGQALAAAGYVVRATTTTAARLPELHAAGLDPYVLALEPDAEAAVWAPVLRDAETVIISLPPGTRRAPDPAAAEARYAARLARLGTLAAAAGVKRIVLLSSTAVYPDQLGAPLLTERAADAAHPLVRAEAALAAAVAAAAPQVRVIVARLGGLMGPGRAPGRFFGAGQAVSQPGAPVNMVHLADAIGAVHALVAHPRAQGAYTICAAQHPRRAAFYAAAARALDANASVDRVTVPPGDVFGKRLSSARVRRLTGYRFLFDSPLAALAAC